MRYSTKHGVIGISDQVLASAAGAAAVSCFGVRGMAGRSALDGLVHLLRGDKRPLGVTVCREGDRVGLELRVALDSAAPSEPLKTYHNCEICVLRNGKGSRDGIQVPRERPARMVVEEKPEEFPAVVSDFLYSSPEAAEPPAEEKRESGRSGRNRRRRGSRPAEDRAPEKNPPKAQKQPPKQSEKQAEKQTDKPRPQRRRGGQKPEGAAPQAAKPQPPKQAAGGEVKKPRHRSGRRHPRRGPGGSSKTEA